MTNKLDIETRLDRSLQNQVGAPRLDRHFDTAVWARIAAEERRAQQPLARKGRAAAASARWMFVTNLLGISAAALLVIFFGLKAFSGIDVRVPVPDIAPTTLAQIASLAVKTLTGAVLVFGLMFTPIGRRVRAELT